ncbi:MAG: monofunctional biosynthetic peptidoglycan transglycosylase [Cereibacter sphaeroides]|uniref:Biosynthetic peptidoglycan transglycosylase n=1 Tax=Cereibacter sphaeroides TaxID=1063 RepID=A0A2W5S060_CERSP|nr:MAG: monofunctional biosynthetic peptidoglycan transglycosylase [Cereibacter sphaeroides]
MATTSDKPKKPRAAPKEKVAAKDDAPAQSRFRRILRWVVRGVAGFAGFVLVLILLYTIINPPTTLYMLSEGARLGGVEQTWVDADDMAPVVLRSVVAAEDANFCLHWGFDMAAIRQAVDQGGRRGASTLSQQVAKNVFLWQGRSWSRKAMEAMITPVVEVFWSKRRILEVYLNVAEFDEGVFGIEAGAQHYFGVSAANLTPTQAARLAAVLPDPKGRDAAKPSRFVRNRTSAIMSGAETIRVDGRAACFETNTAD